VDCRAAPVRLSQHIIILAQSEEVILHGPDFEAGHGICIFIAGQSSLTVSAAPPACAATAATGDAIAPLRMAKAARTNIRRVTRWNDMTGKLCEEGIFFKMPPPPKRPKAYSFSWLMAIFASSVAFRLASESMRSL